MTPAKNILAVTDFSAQARHAADRAARLAHDTGASMTLMHVVPGGPLAELREWLGRGHAMAQQLEDDAQRRLRQLAADLQAHRHVAVQTVHSCGSVLEDILVEARSLDAGLLVMGARGEGFLRSLVLGTTAERLLRLSTVPVLVVRQLPHERYRRVLLAVDFSPWSLQVVTLARQLAPHAPLVLLHAFQVPCEDKLHFAGVHSATIEHYRQRARAQATQSVHALAQQAGLPPDCWTPCIIEGEASQRIVEQEQAQDCDLVVLGKHGQSAAEDLLLGSVTQHVLAEGSADVLVTVQRHT